MFRNLSIVFCYNGKKTNLCFFFCKTSWNTFREKRNLIFPKFESFFGSILSFFCCKSNEKQILMLQVWEKRILDFTTFWINLFKKFFFVEKAKVDFILSAKSFKNKINNKQGIVKWLNELRPNFVETKWFKENNKLIIIETNDPFFFTKVFLKWKWSRKCIFANDCFSTFNSAIRGTLKIRIRIMTKFNRTQKKKKVLG